MDPENVSRAPEPSAADVSRILMALRDKTQEHFVVLYLNAKNLVLATQTVAIGSLDDVQVHPRECFRGALMAGAAAVILVHNHPSGDPTPSSCDVTLTNRFRRAGQLLGIKVLDHVVIGAPGIHNSFFSLRESEFSLECWPGLLELE